uniref:Acid phosphatase n=1 Tax=Panagrellus redivivus TaxID=6233 RepID=A0A7E4VQP8_PANRE
MILSALLVAVIGGSVVADELVHVQVLFRHGDRAPAGTYANDPYQENAWPVPWGELTNDGMFQHFTQGRRLQKRYIQDLKYVHQKYRSNHIKVRSTDVDRTLMSAYAHLAGFYGTSPDTHPSDGSWPSNWSPVPVHTVDHATDRLLNVDSTPLNAIATKTQVARFVYAISASCVMYTRSVYT